VPPSSLAQALLAFQSEAPALQRDKINPHFRSRYLSLESLMEQVLPVLNKHGLILIQKPTITESGQPALTTKVIHAESGEWESDTMLLAAAKPDPQGQGSAITYARRYSAMSFLGLVADEDDDANKASQGSARRPSPGAPTEAAAPSSRDGADSGAAASPTPGVVGDGHGFAASRGDAPTDGGDPAKVLLTFGKHANKTLGDAPRSYVEWLWDKFEPRNPEQNRVKAAAGLLIGAGPASSPLADEDIPF